MAAPCWISLCSIIPSTSGLASIEEKPIRSRTERSTAGVIENLAHLEHRITQLVRKLPETLVELFVAQIFEVGATGLKNRRLLP